MTRSSRRTFLKVAGATGVGTNLTGGSGSVAGLASGRRTLRTVVVPDDYETIQAAVDDARAGDLLLVEPGVYRETVMIRTPRITLRGTDRNRTILDGEFERNIGVCAEADGVAIENLTARHYRANGFYWSHATGFRGSYLTAYNNGSYGIYAIDSVDGRFEHSYASGHPDSGFYIGHRHPFHAIVTDVIAENNAWGYSGTSAGGDLTIRDSVWRNNMAGIVPNTLSDGEPPQHDARIVGNEVADNNNEDAPAIRTTYPAFGTGILLWGGKRNLVANNDVRNHENFGIALERNVAVCSGNRIRNNRVSESGVADLAVGTPVGQNNRFLNNEYETSLPQNVEAGTASGALRVTAVFAEQRARARGEFPSGDWREQPVPDSQPSMQNPQRDPIPADKTHGY
ncbi:right-handed parallel beta-helix repeat-containing protein [Halorussus halophilus]|uniref:right-handed parallel beta-helix repeat-containing protein n=1 Tax=Halorussus halophilus TaxID=2650975 RepID=UPI001787CD88|nr:right-handed parallel beta-helix repeat-containing protein [Halorussus halophilus]